jgi:hypothetical protein
MRRSEMTALKAIAAAVAMTLVSITVGITSGARAEVMARYPANHWVVEADVSNIAFDQRSANC